jgi:cell division protein FtsL
MTTTPVSNPSNTKRIFSAYAEAAQTLDSARSMPLNIQRQWVILFGVMIAVVAMVAGLYLDVTARAAITGREIQNLELTITANRRANADYETDLARLLSYQVMSERAQAAGFEVVERDSIEYMVVPGYVPVDGVQFKNAVSEKQAISAAPEFHQSLLEWLSEAVQSASVPLGGSR